MNQPDVQLPPVAAPADAAVPAGGLPAIEEPKALQEVPAPSAVPPTAANPASRAPGTGSAGAAPPPRTSVADSLLGPNPDLMPPMNLPPEASAKRKPATAAGAASQDLSNKKPAGPGEPGDLPLEAGPSPGSIRNRPRWLSAPMPASPVQDKAKNRPNLSRRAPYRR